MPCFHLNKTCKMPFHIPDSSAEVLRGCAMNLYFHSYIFAPVFSEVYSLGLGKWHEDTMKLCQDYLLNKEYAQGNILSFKICKQIM